MKTGSLVFVSMVATRMSSLIFRHTGMRAVIVAGARGGSWVAEARGLAGGGFVALVLLVR